MPETRGEKGAAAVPSQRRSSDDTRVSERGWFAEGGDPEAQGNPPTLVEQRKDENNNNTPRNGVESRKRDGPSATGAVGSSSSSSSSSPSPASPVPTSSTQPPRMGPYARWTKLFNDKLEHAMGTWAHGVAKRPYRTIVICVLLCLACTGGIVLQKVESDGAELFTPRTSVSKTNRDLSHDLFPDSKSQHTVIILEAKDPNDDVRSKALLLEAFRLHELVTGTTVESGSQTWTYESLCSRYEIGGVDAPFCLDSTPLGYWSNNRTLLEQEASDASVLARIANPVATGVGGVRLFAPLYFGQGNRALRFAYSLKLSGAQEAMEKEFLSRRVAWAAEFPSFNLYMQNDSANEAELENATGGDISLFIAAVALVSVFTWAILSNVRRLVYSHMLLASAGLLNSFMAVGVSFGLGAYFQVPFVGFISTVMFLVVGIGADDTLIIVLELDRVPYDHPPEDRVRRALSHVGGSITLTNITSTLAFAIGAASQFNAITYFCIYASVALMAQYVLTLTFFTACAAVDARRIAQGRIDIAPWVKRSDELVQEPPSPTSGIVQRCVQVVVPLILSNAGRALIILMGLTMLGGGVYMATLVQQGLDIRNLFASNSYLIPFLNAQEDYFILPWPVSVIVVVNEVSVPSVVAGGGIGTAQGEIVRLGELAKSSGRVFDPDGVGVQSWYDTMRLWGAAVDAARPNGTAPLLQPDGFFSPDGFDTLVRDGFLNDPRMIGFRGDVRFADDGKISAFRITVRTLGVSLTNTKAATDQMITVRDALENSPLNPKDYFNAYVYLEGDRVILSVTLLGMGMTLVAVFVLCSLLLASMEATLIVVLAIACIDVQLFAWMYITGVSLDTVSMILLVMSAGLSADYCAHTTHAFCVCVGTRKERATKALVEMGASVFNGGLSTFLGTVVLAAAASTIFRIFFKMFAGIVLLGLFQGLFVVPAILSLVGPSSHATEDPPELQAVASTRVTKIKQQQNHHGTSSHDPTPA